MNEWMLAAILVLVAVYGVVIGHMLGRLREQQRLIPELLDERDRADRATLLLRMTAKKTPAAELDNLRAEIAKLVEEVRQPNPGAWQLFRYPVMVAIGLSVSVAGFTALSMKLFQLA